MFVIKAIPKDRYGSDQTLGVSSTLHMLSLVAVERDISLSKKKESRIRLNGII